MAGFASEHYKRVSDKFQQILKHQPIGGAALSIFRDGKEVVNLWGGDKNDSEVWTEHTATTIFSCTKGLVSILAARLVQESLLDLDDPVAKYWPEFAQSGKQAIPVRWLLEHKAGLSAPRKDLSIEDVIAYQPVLDALAQQEPLWEAGTGHAYHALTFGHLVGRVIFGATGLRIGEYFKKLVADPLGASAWIGIPKAKLDSVAFLYTDSKRESLGGSPGSDDYWIEKSMTFGSAFSVDIAGVGTGFNNPELQMAELAGAGGISTASSLAKIWSATVVETEGARLLNDETASIFSRPTITGPSVWNDPGPWGTTGLGFMVPTVGYRASIAPDSFGHDGLGGQTCFASPEHKIGFAFVTNYLKSGPEEHDRQIALINALRECL